MPTRTTRAGAAAGEPGGAAAAVAVMRRNLLLAVAVLALTVRLVHLSQIAPAPFADLRLGDAGAYHRWAQRIVAGDWRGESAFYQAPLYPYFLAVVYSVFGEGTAMLRFIQAAIGAGSCTLLAAAGMALAGPVGAAAGVLLAVYPTAIFLDGLLEKSALVTFFTAALLYLLASRQTRGRAFLAGIVLGLLSLTRENALLLAVPVLAWVLLGGERSRADGGPDGPREWAWPAAAACVAGCALMLVPVGARNYLVGGAFHLTTAQFGPNFYIGNHAGARGLYEPLVEGHGAAADERDDAIRLAEAASGRSLSADEVSSYWTGRALDFIRAEPAVWLGQIARKTALTFNAVEIADTEAQEVHAESSAVLRVLSPLTFGVIFVLGVFGAVMTAPVARRTWFLYAIALAYTVSLVAFFVFARYRFPLVPVLMLLGTAGIAAWRQPWARRMRRPALVAAVLAGVLAYLPLEGTRADRITHYVNIGNAFLGDRERWDDAQAFYDKALAESPQSPAAHYGVGLLLTLQERPQEALPHFRTAVAGWPDNADLRRRFAAALESVGDGDGARRELAAAAAIAASAVPAPR